MCAVTDDVLEKSSFYCQNRCAKTKIYEAENVSIFFCVAITRVTYSKETGRRRTYRTLVSNECLAECE